MVVDLVVVVVVEEEKTWAERRGGRGKGKRRTGQDSRSKNPSKGAKTS